MTAADRDGLRRIAEECVALVMTQFGWGLDWSIESLDVMDAVCVGLLADGPMDKPRVDLWWKLIGAYTGEVLTQAYNGEWTDDARTEGAFAVKALGIAAFPFSTADRVLHGEPFKSLASLGRVLPAISESHPPGATTPTPEA